MTAEVAILNTHGVALAADSAITVLEGGKKKVYNTANKLFTLSKYHPVGIMIYNNATYMGIDWEIIIKEFRRSLKKKYFNSLFEYADMFIKYVKEYPYTSEQQQQNILLSICKNIILHFFNFFVKETRKQLKLNTNITQEQVVQLLDPIIKDVQEQQKTIENSTSYSLDMKFVIQYKTEIYQIIDNVFDKFILSDNQKENILEIIKTDIEKGCNLNDFSGIVISGYGDKEIFPSIYQCRICGYIGESFILFNEEKDNISLKNKALMIPFAQKEMVQMFMSGIDPDLYNTIDEQLDVFMESLSDIIGSSYKNKLMVAKEKFIKSTNAFQKKFYINPVMAIVESLQKTDLAEMAETLVNLTAFKRHISKDEETVGGPTDVAIITKGDGFVWIKRKHYFDINLNQSFKQNYFMEEADE